jgi:hypothetical protein
MSAAISALLCDPKVYQKEGPKQNRACDCQTVAVVADAAGDQ